MNESDLKRLKQLEEENQRLKHMYGQLSIDHRILKGIVENRIYGEEVLDMYLFRSINEVQNGVVTPSMAKFTVYE